MKKPEKKSIDYVVNFLMPHAIVEFKKKYDIDYKSGDNKKWIAFCEVTGKEECLLYHLLKIMV